MKSKQFLLLAATLALAPGVFAQGQQSIFPPPSPECTLKQRVGLTDIEIVYSRPGIKGRQIYGGLVSFGEVWRTGANNATKVTFSSDVKLNGTDIPAGTYALFTIPGEKEWTIIFSKNSTSWGSFSYEPSEDALRVQTVPVASPFREWLSYEFIERKPDRATVALEWDELRVPFTIEVPDPVGLYVENLRNELRDRAGFTWQGWDAAANYLLQQNRDLGVALQWSENSMALPGVGQANFSTLSTKAQILDKLSRTEEAKAVMATALDLPGASAIEIHQYGRQLLAQGKKAEAMAVFLAARLMVRYADKYDPDLGSAFEKLEENLPEPQRRLPGSSCRPLFPTARRISSRK